MILNLRAATCQWIAGESEADGRPAEPEPQAAPRRAEPGPVRRRPCFKVSYYGPGPRVPWLVLQSLRHVTARAESVRPAWAPGPAGARNPLSLARVVLVAGFRTWTFFLPPSHYKAHPKSQTFCYIASEDTEFSLVGESSSWLGWLAWAN